MQKFQDWFTQQWVIVFGKKIDQEESAWLIGPFGNLDGIGEDLIYQLAEKDQLKVERNSKSRGLLDSIKTLDLPEHELDRLSDKVIHFYERTSDYQLQLKVKWNPFFKFFGFLVNQLFSKRINQLNIPTDDIPKSEAIISEIVTLISPVNNEVKYTIWLRKFKSTGKVIYSGIYGACKIPSGKMCVKAVFPLPKGNATVIMEPSVGESGELILNSSGRDFGDSGFYFLLNDDKGNLWSWFISSFKDKLTVKKENDFLQAQQKLTLWGRTVAKFNYRIIGVSDIRISR